mgnify:CR=1 FL=1
MDRYGWQGWLGWCGALAISLGLVGLAVLPPFVGETARGLVMQAFAGVCHQLPSRSPQIGGVALAVCDRCVGIYGGLALGVLGFATATRWHDAAYRHAGPVLAAALVPPVVDWIGPVLGLWANAPLSRAVTGAFFGVAAGYVLARVVVRAAAGTPSDARGAAEGSVDAGSAAAEGSLRPGQ